MAAGPWTNRLVLREIEMRESAPRDIQAATNYQDQLVSALMEEWAPRVAEAAGVRPGARVLDLARGTGVEILRQANLALNPFVTFERQVCPSLRRQFWRLR
jgi:hypothetical protein